MTPRRASWHGVGMNVRPTRSRVKDAIGQQSLTTIRDVAAAADCPVSTAHRIITELMLDGEVRYTPARYELLRG